MNRKTPGGKRWQDKAFICDKCGKRHAVNPDYTSDAGKVQLIREMGKRTDWEKFKKQVIDPFAYIMDDTGKLADLVRKFLTDDLK